jgi:thiamine-phosphate pyrophosphorylase
MTGLPLPLLMLVAGRGRFTRPDGLLRAVDSAIEGGVNAVQLREKDLPEDQLLDLARRVHDAIAGRALFLVNTSASVAREAGADGVHLPEDAPPVERPAGGFLVGRSVHSRQAAERAAREGVDYLIAGPVYETESHPGVAPAGIRFISEVKAAVRVPVIAIGGITAERVAEALHAGADGVAVAGSILSATDVRGAAAALRMAMGSARAGAQEPRAGSPTP